MRIIKKGLAEDYYERYPNLVTSKEIGGIYATFEICGIMERTAIGIVKIGSVKAFDHLK